MPIETTVRAQQLQPGVPDEANYHAFCTALSASARGRAFLAEYGRRNRNADTKPLLTAIERLHTSLAPDTAAPAEVLVKQKLRALLDDISVAQNEIEASVMAIHHPRHRCRRSLQTKPYSSCCGSAFRSAGIANSIARSGAAAADRAARTENAIAEVAFVEPSAVTPLDDTKPAPAALETPVNTPPSPSAPPDPLASIMALSEEERLALFS